MTSDRLDRIELRLARIRKDRRTAGEWALIEILDIVSDELRFLHNRSPQEQLVDYGQDLLKEKN